MRKLWLSLATLSVLTAMVALVFCGKQIAPYMHDEVFKVLAQLVMLAGVGGLGHLILTDINTSRERREANRTLLRATLNDILAAYNEVKSVRRLLRAEAVRPNFKAQNAHVLKQPYVECLQRISDAQLKLEAQLRLIEGNEAQYPEPMKLRKLLGDAEGYLGKLISEWEDTLGSLSEMSEDNKLTELVILECFLGDAKHSFRPNFANPIATVFAIIGKAIGK